MIVPAEILSGNELVLSRESTLGETLEQLPGLRSSSFGADAGRPVIRGLDGARVKVLSDGVGVLDASTVSPDHVVTSEPLLAERIEVLKGPAALLYSGGAIVGVINVIDRKVPTYVPERDYEADLELRGNTIANERTGAFGITVGSGNFAYRAEGSKRKTDDNFESLHARAGYSECEHDEIEVGEVGTRFKNDATEAHFELGKPDLGEEASNNAELTLRTLTGPTTFTVSLFRNAIDDFIYAADTDRDVGGDLREIEYHQQDAVFTGIKGQVRYQATASTALTLFGDHVRGELKSADKDLPRIPADRLDEKAREHTSFIKDEVLLPGRNLTIGARLVF
jgi:outer membrane receptor protein involved in Fe transport